MRQLAQRQKEFTETLKRGRFEEEENNSKTPPAAYFDDARKEIEKDRREIEELREQLDQIEALEENAAENYEKSIEEIAKELARLDEALARQDTEEAENANARVLDRLDSLKESLREARAGESQKTMADLSRQLEQQRDRQEKLREATRQSSDANNTDTSPLLAQSQSDLAKSAERQASEISPSDAPGQEEDNLALMDARDEIERASAEMALAAANLEDGKPTLALDNQEKSLTNLDKAIETLKRRMDQKANSPLQRYENALKTVRELQRDVAQANPDAPGKESGEEPGQQQTDSNNDSAKQSSSGASSAASADQIDDILTRIEEETPHLTRLLEIDPNLMPFVQRLETEAIDLREIIRIAGGENRSWGVLVGEIDDTLVGMEELLLETIHLQSQIQRLKQAAPESLPPKYHEMASRYFESLGANSSKTKSDKE